MAVHLPEGKENLKKQKQFSFANFHTFLLECGMSIGEIDAVKVSNEKSVFSKACVHFGLKNLLMFYRLGWIPARA